MSGRRTRKVSRSSDGQPKGQLTNEQMLKRKRELFIQQFEKEAQQRIKEMETKLEQLLATADRAFQVELMKMPLSLQNTLIKDLETGRPKALQPEPRSRSNDLQVGEVSITIKIQKPLARKPSKKVKISDQGPQKSAAGTKTEGPKKRSKTRLQESDSTSLRFASSVGAKRTQSRVAKLSDPTPVFGSSNRTRAQATPDDIPVSKSFFSASVATGHGTMLHISEDNKDDLDVCKLDSVALLHMQKLRELIDYVFNKVISKASSI
ncbi:borealin-2 isoform X2 [Denticeps clupeoides]|uniref:borealin-2 isoform X2 n=1 Tax=Denticeps clupeoides TaxID=299321 RepID=UPI0010A4B530|nr:borealin-2-like isoform X2 [Denticeps clupeoides]